MKRWSSHTGGDTTSIALGDDDEFYYTDFSIPRHRVTGTVTAGGRTWEVSGQGYHDHQWMNIHPFKAWHHWLWGRFYTEIYTVVIYDFVTSEEFGFTRVPIFGVMDSTGRVIFDNRNEAEVEIETCRDEQTHKDYRKTSRYTFQSEGTTVEFEITWSEILEVRDMYGGTTEDHYSLGSDKQRAIYDAMGIQPTYMRYYANGQLTLTRPDGTTVTESGDMIYEFNYLGRPDSRAHLYLSLRLGGSRNHVRVV